jgi:hypothetical protein
MVFSVAGSVIDRDLPRVAGVDPNSALRDHADRLRVELVLDRVNRRLQLLAPDAGWHWHLALEDDGTRVDSLVDEVDGDAGRLDFGAKRLPDRVEPGKGRQQRGVDVDHAVAEALHEYLTQQLHVAGEDDQVRAAGLDPVAEGLVAGHAVRVVGAWKDGGLDSDPPPPLQRPRRRLVRPHPDDLDPVPPVQLVEDRLQVGAAARGEDDEAKGAHTRILSCSSRQSRTATFDLDTYMFLTKGCHSC